MKITFERDLGDFPRDIFKIENNGKQILKIDGGHLQLTKRRLLNYMLLLEDKHKKDLECGLMEEAIEFILDNISDEKVCRGNF